MYITAKNKRWLSIAAVLLSAGVLMDFGGLKTYSLLTLPISTIMALLLAYVAYLIYVKDV